MAATFPLAVTVNLKDNLTTGWARMEAGLRARGTSLQNWGKTASKYMTAPLTAFAALSVRAGMNWENSLQRIQRATGSTGEETKAFGEEVFEQSKRGTHSLQDLIAVAEEAAGELGTLAKAQAALAPSADLAKASGLGLVETFKSLNMVMEAYRKDATDLPMLADLLARGDLLEGPGGVDELSDTMAKLSQWAQKKSLGPQQVLSTILAARTGGASLTEIAKWGRQALDGRRNSATDLLDRAVAAGTKASGQSAMETLESARSLAQQLNGMDKTGLESLNSLVSSFNEVLVKGSQSGLLDGFKSILQVGSKILGWLGELPEPVKKSVVYLGTLAAVAGPVTYGLGKVISIASKAKTAWGLLTTAVGASKVAMLGLGRLMMTNPWGIALGVLAHGALLVIDNWELVKEKVGAVWEWATAKWEATWGWILKQIRAAEEFFGFGDNAPTFGGAAPSAGAGAAALPQSPYALALPSAIGVPPAHAEITLNIRGAPKGTSVQTRGDADVTTNLGLAMPHVLGN